VGGARRREDPAPFVEAATLFGSASRVVVSRPTAVAQVLTAAARQVCRRRSSAARAAATSASTWMAPPRCVPVAAAEEA
jgi:hypothetical protein